MTAQASHSGTPRIARRRSLAAAHAHGAGLQRARMLEAVRAGEPGRVWTPHELAGAVGCGLSTARARAKELVAEGLLVDMGLCEGGRRVEGQRLFALAEASP